MLVKISGKNNFVATDLIKPKGEHTPESISGSAYSTQSILIFLGENNFSNKGILVKPSEVYISGTSIR